MNSLDFRLMDKIFQKMLDNQFSDLAGLTVDAFVPLREDFINETLAVALQGNREVTYCRLDIHPQNRITVDVKSPRWPWLIHLKLKLFRSVDLSRSPTVRAFLENNVLLGKLGSMLKALPPGITIYEDQLSVDIGAFLPSDQIQFLELLKAVDIQTEAGTLNLNIKIEK